MSDYIKNIRKFIGHEPLIVVGTNIIVMNDKNEILLQKRRDFNIWGLPGGNMEPGERIEETAKRELFEETGLKAASLTFLEVMSGPEYYYVFPNGDQIYAVVCVFRAFGITGHLKMDEIESLDLKYFDLNALPELDGLPKRVIEKYCLK